MLNTTTSFGFGSGAATIITAPALEAIPVTAVGSTYCYFSTPTINFQGLFAYDALYLNDGSCINAQFRCFPNMTLAIYPGYNCSGRASRTEIIQLSTQTQVINSMNFGSVNASYYTVPYGTSKIGWVSSVPAALLIPTYSSFLDIIQTLFYALTLFMLSLSAVYAGVKYARTKKNQVLFLFVTQVAWIAWVCLRIGYIYTLYPNHSPILLRVGVTARLLGEVVSALTVIYSTFFFFATAHPRERTKIAIIAILISLHIAFSGGAYVGVYDPQMQNASFQATIKVWLTLRPYWVSICSNFRSSLCSLGISCHCLQLYMSSQLPLQIALIWGKSGSY